MDILLEEHSQLEKNVNIKRTADDLQKTVDLLVNARGAVQNDPSTASTVLAKLHSPVENSFDSLNAKWRDFNISLNGYRRAITKKFKDKSLPDPNDDTLSSYTLLINRAIAMHLLRDGQFSVASTFISEASASPDRFPLPDSESTFSSADLQRHFTTMYHILHELKNNKNLSPAINWARSNSALLESRHSNLEFELCHLQFINLFMGCDLQGHFVSLQEGPLRALEYSRSIFPSFYHRYARDIGQLLCAIAYRENLEGSPYDKIFGNELAWQEVAESFTREFCSLLGLSADSPLYIATTAGAIALPTLMKMQHLMRANRTEWTTQHELPVEIPLPSDYHFHSVFVCPVSKEQSTDENPPMMMPCGHVIVKESLDRLSKGTKFKCPYCPSESHPKEAKKLYL